MGREGGRETVRGRDRISKRWMRRVPRKEGWRGEVKQWMGRGEEEKQ